MLPMVRMSIHVLHRDQTDSRLVRERQDGVEKMSLERTMFTRRATASGFRLKVLF